MLQISQHVTIPEHEIEISAIRAQGAGGQNVIKLATAIHLRFDINASSLPEFYKHRLLLLIDHRISKEGVNDNKAQQYRSQEQNREDALDRLRELLRSVAVPRKKRVATKPSKAARQRRLEGKVQRGALKYTRRKPVSHDNRTAQQRTKRHP